MTRVTITVTSPPSRAYRNRRGHGFYLDTRPASYGVFVDGVQVGDVSYTRAGCWAARVHGDEEVFRTFRDACTHARTVAGNGPTKS